MRKSDKLFLEALLSKHKELLPIFKALKLMPISSVTHSEYDQILKHFKNPAILITEKYVVKLHLIQKESNNKLHVITIDNKVSYVKTNKGEFTRNIINSFKEDLSLPTPLTIRLITAANLQSQLTVYTRITKNTFKKGCYKLNENTPIKGDIDHWTILKQFYNEIETHKV